MQKKQEIIIRKANSSDLEQLLQFQQALVDAERPFDSTLKIGDLYYYDLAELMVDSTCKFLVAAIGQKVVGSGYARIIKAKPFLKHEFYAHLGFMFVDANFRRMGINQRIMEGLQEWCATKDISEIRLQVYAGNDKALNAYEKAGFKQHMIEMRLNKNDKW